MSQTILNHLPLIKVAKIKMINRPANKRFKTATMKCGAGEKLLRINKKNKKMKINLSGSLSKTNQIKSNNSRMMA